jgi:hypothetical protein
MEKLYFPYQGSILTGSMEPGDTGKLDLYIPFVMKDEIKLSVKNARWNPNKRCWTADDCFRTRIVLKFLQREDIYARYDLPLVEFTPRRKEMYAHQVMLVRHHLTRRWCVDAAEMGTGKTLAAIETMEACQEQFGFSRWWYIAPKSALESVKYQIYTWRAGVVPQFMTYEEMVRVLTGWDSNMAPPQGVFFDESSRIKTAAAQRTQAAMHLADNIREYYGDSGFVILMSGSPAPKSPVDWWSQCIAEGTMVLTESGPQRIEKVFGSQNIYNDDRLVWSNTGAFYKGVKKVFKISTQEGYEVKATEDHRFLVQESGSHIWKYLKDLVTSDKVVLNIHHDLHWEGTGGTFKQGYILGHVMGDGSVTRNSECRSGFVTSLELWPDNAHMRPLFETMIGQARESEHKITFESRKLDAIRSMFNMDETKSFTEKMLTSSSDFLRGVVSGLFDTDGDIEKNRLRINLTQVNLERLKTVQQILLWFGIPSKIRLQSKAGQKTFQGRRINCQNCYRLMISGGHVLTFKTRIGFLDPKRVIPENIKSQMSQGFVATVDRIQEYGEAKVYDISVPGSNRFSANGFVAHNCETAYPGFLREGSPEKFRDRIGLIRSEENMSGVKYPKLLTWRDSEKKCDLCGKFAEHEIHKVDEFSELTFVPAGQNIDQQIHKFRPMRDEISIMHKRMSGLVMVIFKKDCLDLPEKVYQTIDLKPTKHMLRLAKMIQKSAPTAAQALILMRELSDGFQYHERLVGTVTCEYCKDGPNRDDCKHCSGRGHHKRFETETVECDTPKVQALRDMLEQKEEDGRLIVFAGFTGTLDRICATVIGNKSKKWNYIRVDGRGWHSDLGINDPQRLLKIFQEERDAFPNVCFVGHPGSAGMGLTLTASDTIVYYSNDFNAESRIQSEDRIHRPGSRGCNIVDFIHLPIDKLVLDNLKNKRDLMKITMGDLDKVLDLEEGV